MSVPRCTRRHRVFHRHACQHQAGRQGKSHRGRFNLFQSPGSKVQHPKVPVQGSRFTQLAQNQQSSFPEPRYIFTSQRFEARVLTSGLTIDVKTHAGSSANAETSNCRRRNDVWLNRCPRVRCCSVQGSMTQGSGSEPHGSRFNTPRSRFNTPRCLVTFPLLASRHNVQQRIDSGQREIEHPTKLH